MKRWFAILPTLTLSLAALVTPALAHEHGLQVLVNDQPVQDAVIHNGRTFVSIDGLKATTGAEINWDEASLVLTVNGMQVAWNFQPGVHKMPDGKLYLALRPAVEAMGGQAHWNGETRTVTAFTPLHAVAEIRPLDNSTVSGVATFVQDGTGKVHIVVRAQGLKEPLQGVHIHAVGDCSSPAASGGHFDPSGNAKHGHPHHGQGAHAGDLVNIKADANGVGTMVIEKTDISLTPGPKSVAGRAIVIHATEDKYVPEAIGGGRVACGVITVVR